MRGAPFSDAIEAYTCRDLPFLSAVGRRRNVAGSPCSTDSGEQRPHEGNGGAQHHGITQNKGVPAQGARPAGER
jgi:hypothetical protein